MVCWDKKNLNISRQKWTCTRSHKENLRVRIKGECGWSGQNLSWWDIRLCHAHSVWCTFLAKFEFFFTRSTTGNKKLRRGLDWTQPAWTLKDDEGTTSSISNDPEWGGGRWVNNLKEFMLVYHNVWGTFISQSVSQHLGKQRSQPWNRHILQKLLAGGGTQADRDLFLWVP